jgi:hypothetical protein
VSSSPEAPSRWTGHRPLRLRHFVYIVAAAALSAALQGVGEWQMQPFHHSAASGDRPLWLYYAGCGVALAGMFAVIVLCLKAQVVEVTDDEIALGRRRWSRRSATLIVRPWKRLVGRGTWLEIRSGADVWRVGAPTRRTPAHHEAAAIAAWKLDVLMSTLDFDEILARLGLPEAPPLVVGLRLDLSPYRQTALGTLAAMKPFFLTVLILGVLGPTLGPIVSRSRYGGVVMTPVVLFAAMSGIIGVIVSFSRPARLTRLIIGAEHVTAMDLRSGATLATAPLPALAVQRFHFSLMGGRSRGMSFNNRGLKVTFPSGFSISVALPAFTGWPDRVTRSRAPRWTLDPTKAAALLRALRVG